MTAWKSSWGLFSMLALSSPWSFRTTPPRVESTKSRFFIIIIYDFYIFMYILLTIFILFTIFTMYIFFTIFTIFNY